MPHLVVPSVANTKFTRESGSLFAAVSLPLPLLGLPPDPPMDPLQDRHDLLLLLQVTQLQDLLLDPPQDILQDP